MSSEQINSAIKEFLNWDKPNTGRFQRHEALKSFLLVEFSKTTSSCAEYFVKYRGRKGRIDFVGGNYAVEIDHSMKQRSLDKLDIIRLQGYQPVWILLRPTNSLPPRFRSTIKTASSMGINVILIANLDQKHNKPPTWKECT